MLAIAGGILIAVAVLAALAGGVTLISEGSTGCGWSLLAVVALIIIAIIL